MQKSEDNPMHCGAKTRSDAPCKSWGLKNGRCRMHGGTSLGAPKGLRNGNYRHGYWTAEKIAL
ncbi:HGGxSTG domain-containing protein [Sneathiella sedimenti]|uniref:HGGxSTG domain-containing protein n=1 Tax=Sneathiella sedimenti TaxID=2816034 RepID=UPI003B587EDC